MNTDFVCCKLANPIRIIRKRMSSLFREEYQMSSSFQEVIKLLMINSITCYNQKAIFVLILSRHNQVLK